MRTKTWRPVMLLVLDGWGLRAEGSNNAIRLARTPNFDRLWRECPHAELNTSGADVGLPDGQMGNSEVGHLNIGAGRVIQQDLPRITGAARDGSLGRSPALQDMIEALRGPGGRCHLVGLLSPGGVHSHQNHATALAKTLTAAGVPVAVHALADGRDTPPRSGEGFISTFAARLPQGATIATVIGRFYAMDRDARWDRVEAAYAAIVDGRGETAPDAASALRNAYLRELGDEFVPPTVIGGYAGIRDGDGLLCFNFRADRVREILAALLVPEFDGFARPRRPVFAAAVGMASYGTSLDPLLGTLFPAQDLRNGLGEAVAAAGLAQLRMAESEKFPHVTYFLNGGREAQYTGEARILVPSPKVATYDLRPEMSAPELTDRVVEAIESGRHDLIIMNYANPDMVVHTGNLAAAVAAVEAVDEGLGRVAATIAAAGGALLVTADHGNCEEMRDIITGEPNTAHTTNPVPVLLMGPEGETLHDGRLADVAPTLLDLLGVPKPPEMTGASLLRSAPPSEALPQ